MRLLVPAAVVGMVLLSLCATFAPSFSQEHQEPLRWILMLMFGLWLAGGVLGTVFGIVRHGRVAGVVCALCVAAAVAGVASGVQTVNRHIGASAVAASYDVRLWLIGVVVFGLPAASIAIGFVRSRVLTGVLLLGVFAICALTGMAFAYPWRLAK